MRRIFLGSILEGLWCRTRPSGTSSAFELSFRDGAVTGRVGKELDQKGSNALRNLWRKVPTIDSHKTFTPEVFTKNDLWNHRIAQLSKTKLEIRRNEITNITQTRRLPWPHYKTLVVWAYQIWVIFQLEAMLHGLRYKCQVQVCVVISDSPSSAGMCLDIRFNLILMPRTLEHKKIVTLL